MRELTKQQKIDFCNQYIKQIKENKNEYCIFFICNRVRDFFSKLNNLPYSSIIFSDCIKYFPELFKNFPSDYNFKRYFNSLEEYYSEFNSNNRRLEILQKTLNDLLNENNNN